MRHRQGFTLIELSIVLVIIGLLIGGVIAGKEMIENAKIRAQVNQIEQIKTALNTFRIKYNAVPGDFHARAAAAGLRPGSGGGASAIADNGKLEGQNNETNSDTNNHEQNREPVHFMGHLFDAGLFTGARLCTDSTQPTWPTRAYWLSAINPSGAFIANKYYDETWILFGIDRPNIATCGFNFLAGVAGPIMTPHQAYGIDAKLDDGYPDAGDIITARNFGGRIQDDNSSTGCITAGSDPFYNVTNTSIVCMLRVFLLR